MTKIAFVATVNFAFNQYLEEIILRFSKDNEVLLITNFSSYANKNFENCTSINIDLNRQRSLKNIIKGFYQLFKAISTNKPKLIYSISPIAGFLIIVLRLFLRFKHVHFFTGQVWYNKIGITRTLIKLPDLFIGKFADLLLVDSPSQKEFLENEGVIRKKNSFVMGIGSIRGNKLNSTFQTVLPKFSSRSKNMIYVGRVNKEKGFHLILKFARLNYKWLLMNNIKIQVAGMIEDLTLFDDNDFGVSKVFEILGHVDQLEKLYMNSYCLLLPSEREGFGSVVIEAGFYGVPAILSNIVGLIDSGSPSSALFFEPNNYEQFEQNIFKLYKSEALYIEMSQAAHNHSLYFYADHMTNYFERFNRLIALEDE